MLSTIPIMSIFSTFFYLITSAFGMCSTLVVIGLETIFAMKTGNYTYVSRSIAKSLVKASIDTVFIIVNQYMSVRNALDHRCIRDDISFYDLVRVLINPSFFFKETFNGLSLEIATSKDAPKQFTDYIYTMAMNYMNINGVFGTAGHLISDSLPRLTFTEQNLCRSILASIIHPHSVHMYSDTLTKLVLSVVIEFIFV
jgi:hypothetical protein